MKQEGRCPECGRYTTFTDRVATSVEPHGESFTDEWLECDNCGSQVEQPEVDDLAAILEASLEKLEAEGVVL